MRWPLLLVFTLFLFGCKNQGNDLKSKPTITVSIRPQKYLVEQIAGDRFKIQILVPDGSGPETYEPTPRQMQDISETGACFITGLLDFEKSWIKNVSEVYPELMIVNLSENVNLMKGEHMHSDEHTDNEVHGQNDHDALNEKDHNHSGIDPHIWLSLKELKTQSSTILNTLVLMDSVNSDFYHKNYNKFINYLDSTDLAIKTKVSEYGKPVIYMIYHPSLSYFARDYGLEQIPIELEGKEPGPGYMKELIDIAKAKDIRTIYYSPQLDKRSPETIALQLGIKAKLFNDLEEDIVKNLLNLSDDLTTP